MLYMTCLRLVLFNALMFLVTDLNVCNCIRIPSVQLLTLSKCICPISPISSHSADCIFNEMSLGADRTALRSEFV